MTMSIFRRPEGAEAAGDAMPALIDGTMHLVAGCSPTGTYEYPERVRTAAYRISTEDFVNWEDHGPMTEPGPRGTYDGSGIWTGSLIKHEGEYWHFYTGFNLDSENPQTLCVAKGKDLHNFQKVDANPLVAPIDGFEPVDWRDPFVFFNEEEGLWWMVFSARLAKGPHWDRGCIMAAASKDLLNWDVIPEPIYIPGDTFCPECPELWKEGDLWYLVYSRFSENVGTVYRVGTSPRGPFRTPKDEYLGGRRWYAAKSAEHPEGGRTFFGWIHDKEEVRGKERWLWGGDFTAARRVTQDKNGDLQVALMPQIRDHFAEVLEEKEADISAVGTTRSALLFDPLPENAFLEFSFAFEETPAEYGIMFEEDDLGSGWRVTFDRRTSQIFLTREPRELDDFWADLTHRTGDGREVDGHHLASAMLPNAAGLERQLTVILEGELLELYVDDQVALSYRLKPRKASSLSAFVNDGEARVKAEMRGAAK